MFVSDNCNLSEVRDKTGPRPTPDLSSHAEVSPASAHHLLLLPVACQEEDGLEGGEGWYTGGGGVLVQSESKNRVEV